MLEDCCADGPNIEPRFTDELLSRFDGVVFWRARLPALDDDYEHYERHLAKLDAPDQIECACFECG